MTVCKNDIFLRKPTVSNKSEVLACDKYLNATSRAATFFSGNSRAIQSVEQKAWDKYMAVITK